MEQGLRNKEKQVTWLINTIITLNKNALIHLARLIDNPDSFADNLMTSIARLKFNYLAPFEKTDFVTSWPKECHVMLGINFPKQFSKTYLIKMRYVLSYLCGTLYLDRSVSLKRIFALSVGGLFSLSTHALTCLRSEEK